MIIIINEVKDLAMLALTVTYYQNNDVTIRLTSHDSHG